MAKRKVVEEKRVNNKNEVKIKIWKIINFILIMGTLVFFTVEFARNGVNNVWWNYEGSNTQLEKGLINEVLKMMTTYSLATAGVYAILQVYYYILYTFKLKKVLWISMLISLIVLAAGLVVDVDLYAVVFPIASVLIYMRLLKLEEV